MRVSEILSLRFRDVIQFGQIVDRVRVQKCNTKGKIQSKDQILHPRAKEVIKEYLDSLDTFNPDSYLFEGYKGQPMDRKSAWFILKNAFNQAELQGKVATHSMRKTFAHNAYKIFDGNIFMVAKVLGHKSVGTTMSYLEVDQDKLDQGLLKMW